MIGVNNMFFIRKRLGASVDVHDNNSIKLCVLLLFF